MGRWVRKAGTHVQVGGYRGQREQRHVGGWVGGGLGDEEEGTREWSWVGGRWMRRREQESEGGKAN